MLKFKKQRRWGKSLLLLGLAWGSGAIRSIAQDIPPPSMVFVAGGTFETGDLFGDDKHDTIPVRTVLVSAFYISNYEITFGQYDAFCEDTGRKKPSDLFTKGRGDYPVVNVSWYDAVEYCNWRSEEEQLEPVYVLEKPDSTDQLTWAATSQPNKNGYMLPTEAEWEFAARQRGEKIRFGNGKNTCHISEINYYFFVGNPVIPDKKAYEEVVTSLNTVEKTHQSRKVYEVGYNSLGLYAMSGNVAEWCHDERYEERLVPPSLEESAIQQVKGVRGGSFMYGCFCSRVAFRDQARMPDEKAIDIGFRVVRH
ncbi:MAG TPA: SUMF1/EgtB/PvdO family nonheme iron enzyme [Saprospiraceae bacterium]|nr:SUMF1/EgtB/PvdO family nonheme iron enzyme [Saprospiraceae bacterium]HMQ81624.1 SUMF1/EgtB/PvdO family nonheme iron enzyme [Saprospiraceae bacterium]